jgi:SPP1 family predicted phage head-tail adaptor
MPLSTRIQAGHLRHRLALVQPKNVQDSMGGTSLDSNNIVATVWGKIEAFTGYHDGLAVSEIVSVITHKITIRYPGIPVLSKMQVWFQGPKIRVGFYLVEASTRQFQIEAVLNPDERNKMLYLLCVEINESQNQVTPGAPGDLE